MFEKDIEKYKQQALLFITGKELSEGEIDIEVSKLSEDLKTIFDKKINEYYIINLKSEIHGLIEDLYRDKYLEIASALSGRKINQAGIEAYKVKYQKAVQYLSGQIQIIPKVIELEALSRGIDPAQLINIIYYKGKAWNNIVDTVLLAFETSRAKIQNKTSEEELLNAYNKLIEIKKTSFANQEILANIENYVLELVKDL